MVSNIMREIVNYPKHRPPGGGGGRGGNAFSQNLVFFPFALILLQTWFSFSLTYIFFRQFIFALHKGIRRLFLNLVSGSAPITKVDVIV